MSLPLLRETRMPAVICEIGPASVVVERSAVVSRAVVDSLAEWVDTAWDCPRAPGRRSTSTSARRSPTVIHNLMHRLWTKLY